MTQDIIPATVIGLLAEIFPEKYTHAEIDSLFLQAGAPDHRPAGSRSVKVRKWLYNINNQSEEPLEVLGKILEEYMDQEFEEKEVYDWEAGKDIRLELESWQIEIQKKQREIKNALSKHNLQYFQGRVLKGGQVVTQSLHECVKKEGLSAVEAEIQRALDSVEKDPLDAVHRAATVLESVFKNYLDEHEQLYNKSSDTLSVLWSAVRGHIGINPKELDNKDLKKIASGLCQIVDGTMALRNKKSSAHGQSEEQFKQNNIKPRHARLAIHAAHTLASYVI